jgi:hypothetical protein
MKQGHFRPVNGRTLEQRVWDWIATQERPVRARAVAHGMSLPFKTAADACQRLRRKGCVIRYGRRFSPSTRYEVVPDCWPQDVRGKTLGSVLAIQRQGPGLSLWNLWT